MAFAVGRYYEIESMAYPNRVVNLYGEHSGSTIPNGNVLSLYSATGDVDQRFAIYPYNGGYKLIVQRNEGFVVNKHSGNSSAIMWPVSGATVADSEISFVANNAAQNIYRIMLKRRNLYLTATGTSGTLYWRAATGDSTQLFKFRTPSTGGGGGTGTPGTSMFNGHIVSHAGVGGCLNVYGNETISNNRNVCIWEWSDTNAQTWNVASFGPQKKVFSRLSYPTYALNIYRDSSKNCDVYPHAGNDSDSLIYTTNASQANTYFIRLSSDGLCLTAAGSQNGANVSWQPFTGATNQQWLFTTSAPSAPNVGATFFNGHMVSYAGEGYSLNIHGNETISPNRNVNVWEWSSTNAQTWHIAKYGSAYKVFSRLSHPNYALNVYRDGTNNCDVYPHLGNDSDSIVNLTGAGQANTYYVRLASTGLALTAANIAVGANVSWQPYTGSASQRWLLTNTRSGPEAPITNPGRADSSLVNVFMQAHSNNYTINRSAQGGRIQKITVHHCAGVMTAQSLGTLWQNPSRGASSHYGVSENTIGQYVMEKDVAWTDGNWNSNLRSVTIETSNSSTGGNWPVSAASFNTLVRLVADIARRNGLGRLVKGQNLTWHQMYASTACPGPYLLSKMDELVQKANEINGYGGSTGPVVSAAAAAAGVKLGTKNGVTYYDFTVPLENLFADAKSQAEQHRCMSFQEYWDLYSSPFLPPPSAAAYYSLALGSFMWFYQHVNHGRVWDIKRETVWNAALPNVPFVGTTNKDFLFRGELRSPEEMGNIMYGFVGRACGFADIVLYWGGGVAAQGSINNSAVNTPPFYGDDEDDHYMIELGYNLFESMYPDYHAVGWDTIPVEEGFLASIADLILGN